MSRTGPLLDDLAGIEHDDAVADFGDQPEIVRDEQDRAVQLPPQFAQQMEDLRFQRDIERRRDLVGDQQLRLLPSRLMAMQMRWRMPPENSCGYACSCCSGVGNADAAQASRRLAIASPHALMDRGTGCPSSAGRCAHRIERRHRILEHHGNARARAGAHLAGRQGERCRSPQTAIAPPVTVALPGRRRMIGQRQRRFARTALADDADDLAARDREHRPCAGHGPDRAGCRNRIDRF